MDLLHIIAQIQIARTSIRYLVRMVEFRCRMINAIIFAVVIAGVIGVVARNIPTGM
jgi:hypothetical protein